MPLSGRVFPLCRDIRQRQVDQHCGRLVAGEMPLVPDRLADLAMQALDGVGGVQVFPHLRREGEKQDHLLPAPAQRAHNGGEAFAVGATSAPFNVDTNCLSVIRLLLIGISSQGYPARKLQLQNVSYWEAYD